MNVWHRGFRLNLINGGVRALKRFPFCSKDCIFAAKIVTETVIVPSTTPSLPLPFSFVTFFEDF
jgi:hypothetical protein